MAAPRIALLLLLQRLAHAQRTAAVRDADTWDLQRAWQEAVVEEAARIGG